MNAFYSFVFWGHITITCDIMYVLWEASPLISLYNHSFRPAVLKDRTLMFSHACTTRHAIPRHRAERLGLKHTRRECVLI